MGFFYNGNTQENGKIWIFVNVGKENKAMIHNKYTVPYMTHILE